ncbi:unnamed protein product [Ilex paraguariensis]|uniref:Uncharacterized protein n=1 Tax=Ilex paraguariensis TaxID=185542 RepID=A0ABC8SPX5_9AQUA
MKAKLLSFIGVCCYPMGKVGDVGPILDLMAVVLENIPTSAVAARTTISAVYRTAFPDALFHQLLLTMAHPDHETRVGAHHVFSTVLMPSVNYPWLVIDRKPSQALSGKLPATSPNGENGSFSIQYESKDKPESTYGGTRHGENQLLDPCADQYVHSPSPVQSYSFEGVISAGEAELITFRLSSHQVNLLLSSIWVQATSTENSPANFEAMAHTYNIVLLFTRSKNSSHVALVQCFQLAFSLRSISLDQEGGLQPSRRRSLFTLASCMLIFLARAGNLAELIPIVKSSLADDMIDPYFKLVEDVKLQAVFTQPTEKVYGSQEDEIAALKALSVIELGDQQLKETAISVFTTKFEKLSEGIAFFDEVRVINPILVAFAFVDGDVSMQKFVWGNDTLLTCKVLAKLARYEPNLQGTFQLVNSTGFM